MTEITSRDKVFSKPLSSVKAFEFDEQVTRVFDDMISRSVPGYEVLVRLIALFADIFVSDDSRVYDLGCSTGVVSRVIAQQVASRNCNIVAIDNSPSMIDKCRNAYSDDSIEWICGDLESLEIDNASMVVLNLTLQFVSPQNRVELLQRIYHGLKPGGVLILSEKIVSDNDVTEHKMTELYQGFKKLQGYSDLEISQKRSALEQVLIPDKKSLHLQRLKQCGFSEIIETFHCLNFTSFLAIKHER